MSRSGRVVQEHTGPLKGREAFPVRYWYTVSRVVEHWTHIYGAVAVSTRHLEHWNLVFGVVEVADRFRDTAFLCAHTVALVRDSRMRMMAATTVDSDVIGTKTDAETAVGCSVV